MLPRIWGNGKLLVHRPSSYPLNLTALVLKQTEARLLCICVDFTDLLKSGVLRVPVLRSKSLFQELYHFCYAYPTAIGDCRLKLQRSVMAHVRKISVDRVVTSVERLSRAEAPESG